MTLQYAQNGRVTFSESLQFTSGRVALRLSAPVIDKEAGQATTAIQLESNFPVADLPLTITASLAEVVWNPATLTFSEHMVAEGVPVFQGHVTLALPVNRLRTELKGNFEIPQRSSVWRVRYHVELGTPQGVDVQVEGTSTVFDTAPLPLRFTAATYNLWAGERWPERESAMRALIHATQPDILCVQELRPATRQVLDEMLPQHDRVRDAFAGWASEGNIYWSTRLFELVESGAEDIGILEPLRRLFWVRLRFKGDGRTVLVSTAHYTWHGHPRIKAEGIGPRLEQARRTVQVLDRLVGQDEPVLFMGDLNDTGPAIDVLRAGGLQDSFTSRGMISPPTHPADPKLSNTASLIDWQLHRGPIRSITTEVITFFHQGVAPSDHKPVITTYGM